MTERDGPDWNDVVARVVVFVLYAILSTPALLVTWWVVWWVVWWAVYVTARAVVALYP